LEKQRTLPRSKANKGQTAEATVANKQVRCKGGITGGDGGRKKEATPWVAPPQNRVASSVVTTKRWERKTSTRTGKLPQGVGKQL